MRHQNSEIWRATNMQASPKTKNEIFLSTLVEQIDLYVIIELSIFYYAQNISKWDWAQVITFS
jgi:hypothetical protein